MSAPFAALPDELLREVNVLVITRVWKFSDETGMTAPKLSPEALQQQIAQLGERIRNSQQSTQESKIKFVNSISTHKYLAAQYVKDWEDKVERTGNLNYPEAARKKGASQTLTMDVGISADGSIYSMRIVKSHGQSEGSLTVLFSSLSQKAFRGEL